MTDGSLPLLAFLNHPAMLGWLVAAAAPLIIHLWNRRKHREMRWAAMQYLLAAMRKNARRIRIEQWLLLAVRTALIVLLVLALAEPFLEQTGLKFVSGQRTHKLLVIDASYSMGYRPTDKSRFDWAKEMAARIVDESHQGDGFTLVLMASPPRVVVGTLAFEKREMLDEIDHLKLLDGGADLSATLTKVDEVLDAARREHSRLAREEVYFLTDLGRNTWAPEFRDAEAGEEFRGRSRRLAEQALVVVADLGQAGAENLAVDALRAVEPYATVARDVTFETELRNFGRQAREQQLVELYVDGRRAGESRVDLPPGGTDSATFVYRFDTPGDHHLEVRLPGDLLDVDNHRWFSLPVAGHLRVLCVNGKPSGGLLQGATDYLVVALAPRGPTDDRSAIRPEVVPESALVELDLDQYDCVFLSNVGQFTPNEARLLHAYVVSGGGLVVFLGDQVQAESYNRQLGGDAPDGVRVLPARLGELVARDDPRFLDPLGYRHPLVAAFEGAERSGLLSTRVYRYFKLLVPKESQAKVAVGLDGGDPAIVEESLGLGRSILVATSAADASWTTMPLWPSYVPIAQELLALAVRGRTQERNLLVGQLLGGSLRAAAADSPVVIHTPDGGTESTRLASQGDYSRWTFADTLQSGLYRAELSLPVARQELFAVNVDTVEGDLTKLDLDELKRDVWADVPFEPFDWQNPAAEPTAPVVHRDALHQGLLTGVLGLLLFETGLACWLGRRAS